ncbi:hypothetical protein C8Q76DRAFT_861143 [Earliella scabrosa]|nr:hypothetical protein C8Q76DRAFT_861143 [Earliella scabrosa]
MQSRSSRQLNGDILTIVAEHADRSTAAAIMRCCRALYRYAARMVLAEPVNFNYIWIERYHERNMNHMLSFLRFMGVEDGRRWSYLRGLVFGATLPDDPHMVHALARGIRQAPNIESLELKHIDDFLEAYGEIRDALASLKNVKHLKLANAAKHTCTFLEGVRWPLVTADLNAADELEGDWKLPNIYKRLHQASLLRAARDTLVELSCDDWDVTTYRSRFPDYPHVRSLSMAVWFPMTPEWVKTYPNITRLSVFSSATDAYCMSDTSNTEYDAVRQSNLAELERRCWPRLDEVRTGNVADLYVTGLTCRVRKVDLGCATWGLPLLPVALERVRPVVLELWTKGECFGTTFKTHFGQAAAALQDLEELRISIRFNRDHLKLDVAHTLAEGTSALRVLPKLRDFVLDVTCSFGRPCIRINSRSPSPEPLHVAETSLHGFDRRAFYRDLFWAIPTLESVELQLYRVRGMDQIDERVTRSEIVA